MSFYNHPLLENRSTALREKGAALVVTLLVVVLLATIVAGFLAATRLEQSASRNFTYQNVAEHMAQMSAQQAIAQLNRDVATAISTSTPLITMPGAAFHSGNLIILSSASASGASSNSTNVNFISPMSGFGVIHSTTNTNLFAVPLVDVTNQMHGTNVYGRYAYWVDDDGSRANLNSILQSTAGSTRTNFLPYDPSDSNPRILDVGVFAPFTNALQNGISTTFSSSANSTTPWPYILTPLQIFGMGITASNTNARNLLLPQIAAGPANLGDLWHYNNSAIQTRKINLKQDLPSISSGNLTIQRNFLTNAAESTALTTELDNLISQKIDRTDITNRFQNGFQSKYGIDALRQIIVNINDLHLESSANATTPIATTGFAITNADGIPESYLGLSKFIHLNEIAVRTSQSTNNLGYNRAVELQIWLAPELINPYNEDLGSGSQLIFGIRGVSFDTQYQLDGTNFTRTLGKPDWNWNGNSGSNLTNGVNLTNQITRRSTVATNSTGEMNTFAFEWQVYFGPDNDMIPPGSSNISISRVSLSPAYVKLLQSANVSQTIRDWATDADFGTLEFSGTNEITFVGDNIGSADLGLTNAGPRALQPFAGVPSFNSAGARGIAKNDPRVRRFPGWSTPVAAWFPVGGAGEAGPTLGNATTNSVVRFNTSSGILGINPDGYSETPSQIWEHPSFEYSSTATTANQSYKSVMELGKVHTGLQWRTLHMASQNASETEEEMIPDWALLETFFLTNNFQTNVANPIVKMNINSVHYPAATNSSVNQASSGLLRATALRALLSVASNSTAAAAAGIPSTSVVNSSNDVAQIATNISQLTFNTNWSRRRADLGTNNFPSNAFASVGEVLEISNVANFSTDNAVNEGRAAAFIDAVTTYSDIFSIYSVGYAVDRTGATVAEFAMRTQVQFDPTTGRFRTVFSEPLR